MSDVTIPMKLTTHRSKVNDRKRKRYGWEVTVYVDIDRDYSIHDRPEFVDAVMHASPGVKVFGSHYFEGDRFRWTDQHHMAATFFLNNHRPSKIIENESIPETAEVELRDQVEEALKIAAKDNAVELRREKVRSQAAQLARHFASNARTAAEKAMRYKQRLAGLQAELHEEMKLHQAEELEDVDKLIAEYQEHDPEWMAESVQLAVQVAEKFLSHRHIRPPRIYSDDPKKLISEDELARVLGERP